MLETIILLFAPLVLVPLGLRLSDDPKRGPLARRLISTAQWLQPGGAILLGASFALDQGWPAAVLALPWLVVTVLLAAAGVLDAFRRGWRLDGSAGFTAALLFIPVGGGWAVISRAGLRPQQFSHAIVLLTAVHFHYAGFVLLILAGLVANAMQSGLCHSRSGWLSDRVMLVAVILGVPLVGLGISLSPQLEVAAALLLTCGCVILAARQIQAALQSRSATRLMLLCVSSLALLSAMALAATYAVGEFTGRVWPDIPTMIRTHGAANAFGFALCGLLGWTARATHSPLTTRPPIMS
jgi:hypothetical protein